VAPSEHADSGTDDPVEERKNAGITGIDEETTFEHRALTLAPAATDVKGASPRRNGWAGAAPRGRSGGSPETPP
jgi:hypothetical protein